jgi:hypothetical protein
MSRPDALRAARMPKAIPVFRRERNRKAAWPLP